MGTDIGGSQFKNQLLQIRTTFASLPTLNCGDSDNEDGINENSPATKNHRHHIRMFTKGIFILSLSFSLLLLFFFSLSLSLPLSSFCFFSFSSL